MGFLGDAASEAYNQTSSGDTEQTLLPRHKFQFSVQLSHLTESGGFTTLDLNRIVSIDMPSYDVQSTTINQFNKKRIVQQNITYSPISLIAYDTRDAQIEKFLKSYSKYYYGGVMDTAGGMLTMDDISSVGFFDGNTGTGYKLQDQKYFISKITITRESGGSDTNVITVWNPIITNIGADTLNYSESGLVEYRIDFLYEGYEIETQ